MKRNQTILVVDDEEALLLAIAERLRMSGFKVLSAGNGDRALEAAASPDPIDLIISDLRMPGIRVSEMLQTLRSVWPDLKVILISAYYDEVEVRTLLRLPNTIFIKKPFSLAEILNAVLVMLDPNQRTTTVDEGIDAG